MAKEELLKKVGDIIKKSEELSALKGENFNVFQIFDMERDENKMHSRFIETLLNPKGDHNRGNVFLKLFLELINKIEYFENIKFVNTKVEYTIGLVDNSKGDKSTGGRIDIYIWDNKKSISIENKIYASDQQNQIIRYNNHKKGNNKVFYLTLNGSNPSENSKGSLKSNIDNMEKPDFYCISYKKDIILWLEKCQKEAADYPIIRESIKQYIITIKRLTGQLIDQKMEQDIIDLIKENYKESREIAKNLENAKIKLTDEFLNELKGKLEKKLAKNWKIELEDINDEKDEKKLKEWRKLLIYKNGKKEELSIVLEGQPFSWKNKTILGLHSGISNENPAKKVELESYLKDTSIDRNEYPESGGAWLLRSSIFNFGVEDKFEEYAINNRDIHIGEVSTEIIDLVKQIENYFE